MSPETLNKSAKHLESRRKFISEAFHAFHQPLTALHCGIELSLLKPRTEDEYRQRLEDALQNAGSVLQLNKLLRELVEAADPGENFGRVQLYPPLSRLVEELAFVTEAELVELKFSCPENISVEADPDKLMRHFADLANVVIAATEPGGAVHLKVQVEGSRALITFAAKGVHRECREDTKLNAIRIDAACSYIWTIGGDFKKSKTGFSVGLDLSN